MSQIDLQQEIGHTHFNIKWFLDIVKDKCSKFQDLSSTNELSNVTFRQIGQEQGYNSNIYLIQAHFSNNGIAEYCLKTLRAKTDSQQQNLSDQDLNGHNRECLFYREFSGIEGIKIPKVYSSKQVDRTNIEDGYILIEFMGPKVKLIPLSHSYTKEQLFSVVKQLSCLHAFSYSKRSELEDKFWRILNSKKVAEDLKSYGKYCQQKTKDLEEYGGGQIAALLNEINERVDRHRFAYYAAGVVNIENGVPPLLTHTDLWGNNVLFEFDGDQATSNLAAIIDWQFAAYGNFCQDLARLIIMNVDTELRRSVLPSLFEYYCQEFHKNLKTFDESFDGKQLFSEDQLQTIFDVSFVSQIHFSTHVGTIMYSNKKADPNERQIYFDRMIQAVNDALSLIDKNLNKWSF